jgi:hypothetical protein
MNDNYAAPTLAQPSALALPDQLAQQAADAVRELLAEAAAENTTRSYATALRYWAGWHAARYGVELALPVSEAAVLQFVVDHVQRRSGDGALTWELPTEVDQALVAAGLKAKLGPWTPATGSRCCPQHTGSSTSRILVNNRPCAPCSVAPREPRSSAANGRARKPRLP